MSKGTTLTAEAVIKAIDQFSGPVTKMAGSLGQFGDRAKAAGIRVGDVAKKVGAVGTAATVALAIPLGRAVQQMGNYEEVLLSLRRVYAGTDEQFKEFRKGLEALEVPVYERDLAAIAEAASAAQVGVSEAGEVDNPELLKFLQLAAEFSAAFNESASASGEHLAVFKESLGFAVSGLRVYADQMSALDNLTGATGKDLLALGRELAPLSRSVGGEKTASQLLAVGSAIISMGKAPGEAATGIRNLIIDLNSGEAASLRAKEALEQLGFAASEMPKRLTKDAGGTILELFKRLSAQSGELQIALLRDLSGRKGVDALAPLLANVEELERQLNIVGNAELFSGATFREFEVVAGGFNAQIIMLNKELGKLVNTLVEQFMPMIKSWVKTIRELLQEDGFAGEFTRYATIALGAAVALGPALLAIVFGFQAILGFKDLIVGALNSISVATVLATAKWVALGAAIWSAYKAYQWMSGNKVTGLGEDIGRISDAIYGEIIDSAKRAYPALTGGLPKGKGERMAGSGSPSAAMERFAKAVEEAAEAQRVFKEKFGDHTKPIPVEVRKATGATSVPSVPLPPHVAPGQKRLYGELARLQREAGEAAEALNNFDAWAAKLPFGTRFSQGLRDQARAAARAFGADAPSFRDVVQGNAAELLGNLNIQIDDLKHQLGNRGLVRDFAPNAGPDRQTIDVTGKVDANVTGQANVDINNQIDVKIDPSPEFLAKVRREAAQGARAAVPLNTGQSMPDVSK